jgi:hypothetical protein
MAPSEKPNFVVKLADKLAPIEWRISYQFPTMAA